jgi:hypothetical protein
MNAKLANVRNSQNLRPKIEHPTRNLNLISKKALLRLKAKKFTVQLA